MTVEERIAALEAMIAKLEAEVEENAKIIAANKASIEANKNSIASNKATLEKHNKGFMDLMADHMAETYASHMTSFVDPSVDSDPATKVVETEDDGISKNQQMQNDYTAVPEVTPEEIIEAASYIASPAEIEETMKAAGIEKPAAAAKEPKEAGESADQQMQNDYTAVPELNPIETLEMEAIAGSPAAIKEAIEAVEK